MSAAFLDCYVQVSTNDAAWTGPTTGVSSGSVDLTGTGLDTTEIAPA